jgi:hypothetical protein
VALPVVVALIMDAGVFIMLQLLAQALIQMMQIPDATTMYALPVGLSHLAMNFALMLHLQTARNRTSEQKRPAVLIRMVYRYGSAVKGVGLAELI